jgi:DNA-binding HxlR family transcriptional regulator
VTSHPIDDTDCRRMTIALEFAGKRWNGAVLLALARGADRFSEILRIVPGLSDRMLAVRLKELEQHGAVTRTVIPTTPVQVRYALSEYGSAVLHAIRPLASIGARMEAADVSAAGRGPGPDAGDGS